jgi:hypothetical protein
MAVGHKSVEDSVRDGKYKVAYPDLSKVRPENRHQRFHKYRSDQNNQRMQFRQDLEKEFGVVGHPKAHRLFTLAWERAHAEGYEAVLAEYVELVDLIRE